ncbi:MAG: heat-inducible transcriptional repressor HrcA [Acidimicrobiia bacterium]
MDERKSEVLRAVIEEYIATGQPVASSTIVRSGHLRVSSATIRHELNELERDGYLTQPHTSSGRVPTDLGYRFYVDALRSPARLTPRETQAIAGLFQVTYRALEDMLEETSRLLSGLTGHASVVVGPEPTAVEVRSVQLVELQPGMVLLVTVLSNGAIEKSTLMLNDVGCSSETLARAGAHLAGALVGRRVDALPTPSVVGDSAIDAVVGAARAALTEGLSMLEHAVHVTGKGKLASGSFDTMDRAVRLLELLEQQVVVVTMVREVVDAGLSVRIGAENEIDELRNCSLVLARYGGQGAMSGTVGLLGPTRMDYRRALATVAAVSEELGRTLTQ